MDSVEGDNAGAFTPQNKGPCARGQEWALRFGVERHKIKGKSA